MPEVTPLREGDPRRLGDYTLTGLLGEGGQGAVYLGEDEPGHRVAVKLLHARFSGDPKARQRFAAEVAVAQRVAPFCTARILDSDVEGDRPYIVSEYIDGPALSQVLAEEGPRRGTALDRLAIGTMTALAAIHEAGVVHRDFKPANVLMAADGPRVIDFGIARALDATGTLSSTAVGTPAYMAPEQISGAQVGPAADVFAWGATMVYAGTGRPAFGQDTIPAVMHRILNLPPDLGDLADPLRTVVADALAKDPAWRPTAQQVLIRLLSLAGSLPQQDAQAAAVLGRGAEAAVTGTFRPQAGPVDAPPAPPWGAAGPGFAPPPPLPGQQAPHGQQATRPPGFAYPMPGAPTVPAGAGGPGGGRKPGRRRGVGVLAGAGAAGLVAAVLVGSAVVANMGEEKPTAVPSGGRTGGALRAMLSAPSSTGGSLAPSHADIGTQRAVAKHLFTGLTEVAPSGALRNRLATALTPDSTCLNWTITLKEGTRFSNGEPVDAEAFARGWARAAQYREGLAGLLMADVKGYADVRDGKAQSLAGVSASGHRLQVALTSPDCEFPTRLANPVYSPAPRGAGRFDNAAYNDRPVGNGPFKVRGYDKDRSIALERNPDWAFGRVKLDTVEVRLDATAAARSAFASGEVGYAELNAEVEGAVSTDPGLLKYRRPSTRVLVPLTQRGPMASKEGRLAVSYALDRKALSDTLYRGVHTPARGLVPPPVEGATKGGVCPSCDAPDPEKAKTLAAQARLGGDTTLRLYTQQQPSQLRVAEVVKGQLQRTLGWKVEIKATKSYDYTQYRKELTAKDASGLAIFQWQPDYPTGSAMMWPLLGGNQIATASNGLNNYSGWKSARFDELMGLIRREPNLARRTSMTQEAEKLALDDMALVPLLNYGGTALRSAKYVGLGTDFDGDPTFVDAALK
ncbi:ABC transporter substrate-binding protein [Spirillospora sp. NPDC127200]